MIRKSSLLLGLLAPGWVVAAPSPLDLDASFGAGGMSRAIIGDAYSTSYVWNGDGTYIYTLTPEHVGSGGDPAHYVTRRSASDGAIDTEFGNEGTLAVQPMTAVQGEQHFNAICSDAETGAIYLVGTSTFASDAGFDIYRMASDGTPDPEWGTEGYLRIVRPEGSPAGQACIVQPDGKLVVAGGEGSGSSYAFAARLGTDGMLDAAFGVEGMRRFIPHAVSPSAYFTLTRIVRGPADSFFMAGEAIDPGQPGIPDSDVLNAIVVKLTSAGALAAFGASGVARSYADGIVGALRPQPNGQVVLAQVTYNPNPLFSIAVSRFMASGSADLTYGCNGVKSGTESYSHFIPYDAGVDAQGRLLMAGQGFVQSQGYQTVVRAAGLPEFSTAGGTGLEVAAGCGSSGGGGGLLGWWSAAVLFLGACLRRRSWGLMR